VPISGQPLRVLGTLGTPVGGAPGQQRNSGTASSATGCQPGNTVPEWKNIFLWNVGGTVPSGTTRSWPWQDVEPVAHPTLRSAEDPAGSLPGKDHPLVLPVASKIQVPRTPQAGKKCGKGTKLVFWPVPLSCPWASGLANRGTLFYCILFVFRFGTISP